MCDYFCVWWGHWDNIEIVLSLQVCVHTELWVGSRLLEEIQHHFTVRDKLVPELEGKVRVHATETGNKTCFSCLNRPFCVVGSVVTGLL